MPDPLLENYTFVSSNCPNNSRHDGVGLLYKNCLPLKVRDDMALDETNVVELPYKGILPMPMGLQNSRSL